MRKHHRPGLRWLVLATLGAFAALVPTASADTALPLWTCRASAGYVELDPLLGAQRVEPIVANGFADRDAPDAPQCARQTQGVPNVTLPPAGPGAPPGLSLELQAPFARTDVQPEIGFARDQTVTATGGVVDPLTITLGQLVITARAVSASANGTCNGTTPALTGSSTVLELTIGNTTIPIPSQPGSGPTTIDLSPIAIVTLNETERAGSAATADESATFRAVHIQVLPIAGAQPAANVVLGEAKVDRHGAVCAPPPPPPVCPAGSTPQDPNASPLVCVLPGVPPPCPTGSTPDPANGNACVIIRQVPVAAPCPAGSTPDPNNGGACIVVRQVAAPPAACPSGSERQPGTNNCIVTVVRNTASDVRPNGAITGSNARPTCGRLEMHFVRGGRRTLTSRFGTRLVTRGRLVTCGSRPRSITGARIDVIHVLPDGRRLRKTGLRSRAAGRLTLILPLDLRSRRIEYAYRPDLSSARVSSRVTLRLTVRDRRGRTLR